MKIKLVFFALFASFFLAGCGGGSSSSGGGSTDVVSGIYKGTYSTALYSGSITVTINGSVGRIDIDHPCLNNTIGGLSGFINNNTNYASLSGEIGSRLNDDGIPAYISVEFPASGGSGDIVVDSGGGCASVVGGLNVVRQ